MAVIKKSTYLSWWKHRQVTYPIERTQSHLPHSVVCPTSCLATAQTLWTTACSSDLVRHGPSVTYKAMISSFLCLRKAFTLRQATLFHKIPGDQPPHDLFLLTHHPSSFSDKWWRMRKSQGERTANGVQEESSPLQKQQSLSLLRGTLK